MQVGRWGKGLAVCLPAAVVDALNLREGDEITIEVADPRHFRILRDSRRDDARHELCMLGWSLPDGVRFDRDEANTRGA